MLTAYVCVGISMTYGDTQAVVHKGGAYPKNEQGGVKICIHTITYSCYKFLTF